MKGKILLTLSAVALLTGGVAQAGWFSKGKPETVTEKASYAMTYSIASQMSKSPIDLSKKWLEEGFTDGIEGKKPAMTEDEMKAALQEFQQMAMKKGAEMMQKMVVDNAAVEKTFLAENLKKGFKVTKSGLQYKVMTQGKGPKPGPNSMVQVEYKGEVPAEFHSMASQGKATTEPVVFDQTPAGQTATLPLNQVIPGWQEGLSMMPVGSTYVFVIPAKLAYGEQGQPQAKIPPNATLEFTVTLKGIKAAPKMPAARRMPQQARPRPQQQRRPAPAPKPAPKPAAQQ